MSFRDINGLVECQKFSDFWKFLVLSPDKRTCPVCEKPVLIKNFFLGFNMDKAGYVRIKCSDPECIFNEANFTVAAVQSEPKGGFDNAKLGFF